MKFVYIILLVILISSCGGTRKVVDYTVISTMVEIHKTESGHYRDLKDKETTNTTLQTLVTKTTEEYRAISDKIERRYTDVSILLSQVGKLPQIIRIINDIQDYQVSLLEIVQDHPEFVLIGINTEVALMKRVTRLYKYVYLNAILGTDLNKMPIAKRLEIVDHVLTELRVIRGLCYSISSKMKNAVRGKGLRIILREYDLDMLYEGIDKAEIIRRSLPIRQ